MFMFDRCRTILPSRECSFIYLHKYYTVNMAIANYFGTQIPEIEKIDGHTQINQQNCMEKI